MKTTNIICGCIAILSYIIEVCVLPEEKANGAAGGVLAFLFLCSIIILIVNLIRFINKKHKSKENISTKEIETNMQLKCPKCGSTDFEFMVNSNVHSSWLTGRTITTNRGANAICKKCGSNYALWHLKNLAMREAKTKLKNKEED